MRVESARQVLERTPLALRGLLEGLDDEWVTASEGPDTFSPRDVVGHLIYGERTDWTPRLRLIGRHPVLGTVTLRQLLATWVVHDLGHLGQIARVLAKQYREEVGPWTEYLTILSK